MQNKNKTPFDLKVDFTYEDTGYTESVYVYIPFDMFVEAIRVYCDKYRNVKIDGKDSSVWNMFSNLGALESFYDDEDFIKICQDMYEDSPEKAEAYADWVDSYEMENDLGKYN